MNEQLVLIFAYHYPPENAIGGARPRRLAKYLSKLGYECRIFTAADQTGRDDPTTEYVPDPFVTCPRHTVSWQVERAIRKFFLPGERGILWSCHAARAARAYLRAHPHSHVTLFSTFPPLGPHCAAWQVAHSEGLPWIADFRDPFPDRRDFGQAHLFREGTLRWLEKIMTRRADAIIANADAAMVRWQERFPSLNGKIHLIWNGFDPEERVLPLPTTSGNCKVLSHTGELYSGRNATPILESLARLIGTGRLSAGSVRLRLIGAAEPGSLPNQVFLDRARAEGWLELVTKQIPQREAQQIAQSSHGLLLMQLSTPFHVPAKIFEYLQIGRPILAFIQPNSPSERLLAQSGVLYRCVYPGSPPETIDEIVADFFSLPSEAAAPRPWFEEQFNAENQTRQLDAIIRSLHNEPLRMSTERPRFGVATRRVTPNQKIRVSNETEKRSSNLVHPS